LPLSRCFWVRRRRRRSPRGSFAFCPLTEAEKRLSKFLVDEAASIPPQLTALLERAA
jgi:hypothetical protein